MKYDKNLPIYWQIKQDLLYKILTHKYLGGEKLPSVRELCVLYSVTPVIMNRSIKILEQFGIIETKRGIGSFVTTNEVFLKQAYEDEIEKIIHECKQELKKLNASSEVIGKYWRKND